MTFVLVKARIEDYAKFRTVFDGLAPRRKEFTSKDARVFRNSSNPNEVVILMDLDDVEKARQYLQSDELRQSQQRAGTLGPPEVSYLDEV